VDALEQLTARAAIIDLITTLFVATDERDWPRVRDCFAPVVHFDMTSLAGGKPAELSPQAIADGWESGLRPIRAVHHQAGNFRLSVRERDADASCYAIACHWLPNPTGRNTRVFVGDYDFHLLRDGDRWAIDRFTFRSKFVDGNLALEREGG
jgi:hypothetical protein